MSTDSFIPDRSKLVASNGNRLLKSIFYELAPADKSGVVYTLKDHDHLSFPSLYRLYMAEGDLTEYEFANKYLDSWEHWKMLCECTWFKPYLERWREELYLKEAAKALRQIKALSKSSSRDAFQAQRYLLEKGWMPKEEKAKRGRPSQDEVKKAAKEIATDESRILEDLKRIGQNKELIN